MCVSLKFLAFAVLVVAEPVVANVTCPLGDDVGDSAAHSGFLTQTRQTANFTT